MPVIRTFVSHHGGDYAEHIAPILRQVAPLGIRPWIDKRDLGEKVGLRLDEQLRDAIFNGSCSSMSLFLTKGAATRRWIDQEVRWAKERIENGFRILPIWLDPPGSVDLPQSLRSLLEENKVLWLEPYKDPRFVEKYVASVLATAGVTKDTEELTLYVGHRSEQWDAVIPAEWESIPTLDLRMDVDGAETFSPNSKEWKEIEAGLRNIRKLTGSLLRLNICGQAPLGVNHIIGKVWDRSAGQKQPLELRAYNANSSQIWSTTATDYDLSDQFRPERAALLELETPLVHPGNRLLCVVSKSRKEDFYPRIQRWNQNRKEPSQLLFATYQPRIDSKDMASTLLRELVGAIRYLRKTSDPDTTLEVITGYPLALAPLFSYHLRTLGPIHFYDEVKPIHSYRLATIIP